MGIVIRQSLKGTIVTYAGAFIGFLTTFFIVAKFLSAEEYGLTRTLFDAAALISGIALVGLNSSIPKFFPYFKNPQRRNNGFFFYIVSFAFIGLFLAFLFTFLFQNQIKGLFAEQASLFVDYFYLIFPLAFFLTYQTVFDAYSAVLMRIVVPRFIREVVVRIMTIIVFLLYAFGFINLDWMIYLYVAEYGIATLINLIYISKIGTVSLSFDTSYVRKPLQKYIFRFTGYALVTTIGVELVNRIGTLMISSYEGLNSAGVYNIALFMAAIVEIPSRSLSSISAPLISTHIKEKRHSDAEILLKKVTLNQFLIGVFVFTILWINVDNIFAIIPNGEIYSAGKMVVFFIGLTRLCDLIGNVSIVTLNISKYYYFLFFVILISAITILGNHFLIPVFGITGSSISSLISMSIYYIAVIIVINKKLKYNPLSKGILKVLVLMGLIFLLNSFSFALSNPILDAGVRTVILGGIFILVTYFWKISLDMNNLVEVICDKVLSALKRKK